MFRRWIVVVSCLAPMALLAGACSSGDDSAASSGPSTVTVTASDTTPASGNPGTPAPGDGASTTGDAPATGGLGPTDGVPPFPSRDDANVDARDFEIRPGEYYFKSPSENVYCAIRTSGLLPFGCQAKKSVRASNGTVCANSNSNGYAVSIEGQKVNQFCTTQGIFNDPNPRVLQYGETLIVRGDSCTSTTAGVTCYRSPSVGFTISREANRTLP